MVVFATLLFVFPTSSSSASAQLGDFNVITGSTQSDFKILIDSVEANVGEQVIVPIYFQYVSPNTIPVFSMEVIYDPTKLEFVSHELGEIIPYPSVTFGITKESDGVLKLLSINFLMASGYDITEDGLLINLVFNVLSTDEDTTTIDLQNTIVGNQQLEPLPTTVCPGTVTIKSTSNKYTLRGYIKPNLTATISDVYSGFNIISSFSAITDEKGYFEIRDVPAGTYNIKISKTNYLTREIENFTVDTDVELSTSENPILLWAGDLEIDGVQDGAVNMSDIIELCKHFNYVKGEANYSEQLDLNLDGAINLEDVLIVAKHFNSTALNY